MTGFAEIAITICNYFFRHKSSTASVAKGFRGHHLQSPLHHIMLLLPSAKLFMPQASQPQ
jgi:hypothetical protein